MLPINPVMINLSINDHRRRRRQGKEIQISSRPTLLSPAWILSSSPSHSFFNLLLKYLFAVEPSARRRPTLSSHSLQFLKQYPSPTTHQNAVLRRRSPRACRSCLRSRYIEQPIGPSLIIRAQERNHANHCHRAVVRRQSAEVPADSAAMTDANGNVVVCHRRPCHDFSDVES
jgi:hypothetical protein